jgi:type IV pilus assembly protein PilM
VALFQIGAGSTHVSVLRNGDTVYEKEQAFGGNTLTQEIVRAYGMTYEEAETRKKSGELAENFHADVLTPFLESAALEVTRAIQFFYTSTPYTRIDQIWLAGGSAQLPGLAELIGARTRIPSAVATPFEGMLLAAGLREAQLRSEGPGYIVACGLALRRFG